MTREKLLQAALKYYSQKGYHGATMRKIAEEAGIKPGSIYFFYDNKEMLFTHAFRYLLEKHHEEMVSIYEQHEKKRTEDILKAIIRGLATYHMNDVEATRSYISLLTMDQLKNKAQIERYLQDFNDWLAQSIETTMRKEFQDISERSIKVVTSQFMLIANGIFWSVNVMEEELLNEQLRMAELLIDQMFMHLYEENVSNKAEST